MLRTEEIIDQCHNVKINTNTHAKNWDIIFLKINATRSGKTFVIDFIIISTRHM